MNSKKQKMQVTHTSQPAMSLRAALLAGLIAITLNTVVLYLAQFIPLRTEAGGLLKVLKLGFGDALGASFLNQVWNQMKLPSPESEVFKTGFHVFVGLGMALFYAAVFEPWLSGTAWRKGFCYALLAWLLNAFVVLPWIGEGIAGNHHLALTGMVYYAAAHTIFFVLLALLYARFRR